MTIDLNLLKCVVPSIMKGCESTLFLEIYRKIWTIKGMPCNPWNDLKWIGLVVLRGVDKN